MNGMVINIDPVILRLGNLVIEWHGALAALAALAGVLIADRECRKRGIPPNTFYFGALLALIGGLVGARLFHVIDHFDYYYSNPTQIFQFQGLAIWGGLIGGGAVVLAYARIKHFPLGRIADALVPAVLVGQIIGRIGCAINGDAYGGATGLPWGFTYVHPDASITGSLFGIPTHPYPVYEILWNAAALLLLLRLRRHFRTDGMLFLSYVSIYSLGRITLSFVRQENTTLWGLQQAQVLGIIGLMAAATIAIYIYLSRKSRHTVPAEITL